MIVGIIFLVCNIMLILIMGAVTMGMHRRRGLRLAR
jgi:hypothetical protein